MAWISQARTRKIRITWRLMLRRAEMAYRPRTSRSTESMLLILHVATKLDARSQKLFRGKWMRHMLTSVKLTSETTQPRCLLCTVSQLLVVVCHMIKPCPTLWTTLDLVRTLICSLTIPLWSQLRIWLIWWCPIRPLNRTHINLDHQISIVAIMLHLCGVVISTVWLMKILCLWTVVAMVALWWEDITKAQMGCYLRPITKSMLHMPLSKAMVAIVEFRTTHPFSISSRLNSWT